MEKSVNPLDELIGSQTSRCNVGRRLGEVNLGLRALAGGRHGYNTVWSPGSQRIMYLCLIRKGRLGMKMDYDTCGGATRIPSPMGPNKRVRTWVWQTELLIFLGGRSKCRRIEEQETGKRGGTSFTPLPQTNGTVPCRYYCLGQSHFSVVATGLMGRGVLASGNMTCGHHCGEVGISRHSAPGCLGSQAANTL